VSRPFRLRALADPPPAAGGRTDQPGPAAPGPLSPASVVHELVSLVGCAARLPAALRVQSAAVDRIPPAVRRPGTRRAPVLLVHGYLGTSGPWAPLAAHLSREGFEDVFALSYPTLSSGVPQAAAALVQAVDTVLQRTGQPAVHLVGHSLGGLVVRYAVQVLGLDRTARTAVTVATPHAGSWLAWMGAGPAAVQMRPGSPLLTALPPLDRTGPVRWAVIAGGADVVAPSTGPDSADLVLPGLGHHALLGCSLLAEAVTRHLTAVDASAPPEQAVA
jgi:pimeloyl-ACP methyl ester carboxylesterase